MNPESRHERLAGRTLGERPFDRVLQFVVFLAILSPPLGAFIPRFREHVFPYAPEVTAALIGITIVSAWIWLLWRVMNAWNDPGAKILRLSSSVLLAIAACLAIGVLKLLHRHPGSDEHPASAEFHSEIE